MFHTLNTILVAIEEYSNSVAVKFGEQNIVQKVDQLIKKIYYFEF